MRRSTPNRKATNPPPRSRGYVPTIEPLEERLHPGDVLLGGMLVEVRAHLGEHGA
jgi:hypothetical protein